MYKTMRMEQLMEELEYAEFYDDLHDVNDFTTDIWESIDIIPMPNIGMSFCTIEELEARDVEMDELDEYDMAMLERIDMIRKGQLIIE